jgi:RimJ/RimL family protein N-acetyltransferase
MELVWPSHQHLAGYVDALDRGWSPDNVRSEAGREEVVPWKRGRGYATRALALLLPDAATEGLAYGELTTDLGNAGSQAVIRANGGELVEQFQKPAAYGDAVSLRFRIPLASSLRPNDR